MAIGDNIRRLRELHELTQRELGKIAGVSDKAVSTWENGIKTPRMTAIKQMAEFFGVSAGDLLADEPPERDTSPTFAQQMSQLCLAWGFTPEQIARESGVAVGRVQQLLAGNAPTDAEMTAIAQVFRAPQSVLRDGTSPLTPDLCNVVPLVGAHSARLIPVLGRVPAGIPIEAVTDIVEEIDLSGYMANDGYDYFGLLVTGDSMMPEYRDGDVVILRMQTAAQTGDDVVAYIGGSDATLKRLTVTENGIQLRPLNPNYEIRCFSHEEVRSLPVTIAGIVIEQRRRRRHG